MFYLTIHVSAGPVVLPLFAGDTDFFFIFIKKKKKKKSQYSKGPPDQRTTPTLRNTHAPQLSYIMLSTQKTQDVAGHPNRKVEHTHSTLCYMSYILTPLSSQFIIK